MEDRQRQALLAKVGEVAVKHCRSLAVGEVGFVVGAEVSKLDVAAINADLSAKELHIKLVLLRTLVLSFSNSTSTITDPNAPIPHDVRLALYSSYTDIGLDMGVSTIQCPDD